MAHGLPRRAFEGGLAAFGLAVASLTACSATAPAPASSMAIPTIPAAPTRPAGAPDAARPDASAAPVPPSPSPSPSSTDGPPRAAPAPRFERVLRRVDVPGDKAAVASPGAPGSRDVLVYLHGKCGDPEAFRAFVAGVPARFTVVSVRGEIKCEDGSRSRWAGHVPSLDARIARAVAAASTTFALPLRTDGWFVLGYSQGALRAEALLAKLPRRYAGAILAAGPRAPRDPAIGRTGPVVLLAGALDLRGHLMKAADDLAREGLPVVYRELPGARHGEYGPEAEAVLAECLGWLGAHSSFRDE